MGSSDVDCYLGEIRIFAGSFAPPGWSFCNGGLLPINEYEALYSLIGTTYGGDGRTTFGLPDLRSRIPIGFGQGPNTGAGGTAGTNWSLAQTAGAETVALTAAQIPAHTHAWQVSTDAGKSPTPEGNVLANPVNTAAGAVTANLYNLPSEVETVSPSKLTAGPAAMIGNAGGNQAHGNIMPYISLNYIIAVTGFYPDFQ